MPGFNDAIENSSNDIFIQSTGAFLAIAGDEWNGVAFIEQLNYVLDLPFTNLQILSNSGEIRDRVRSILRRRSLHKQDDPWECVTAPMVFLTQSALSG